MTFWEGFAYYVGVQGVLAVGLGGAIVYLAAAGQPIPTELWTTFGAVMGYYFGANGKTFIAKARGQR